jgi:hypothetical protein
MKSGKTLVELATELERDGCRVLTLPASTCKEIALAK